MPNVLTLAKLARLARNRVSGLPELVQGCSLIARHFRARSAYVISQGDSGHRQLGVSETALPTSLTQQALSKIILTVLKQTVPLAFDIVDGEVVRLVVARTGLVRGNLVAHLPIHQQSADVLVVDGIRRPISSDDIGFIDAAALVLSHLATRVVDAEYGRRKRDQLNALAHIGGVMARSANREVMLADLARACAAASSFETVAIAGFDESTQAVTYRARSGGRYEGHDVSVGYVRGAFDHVLIQIAKRRRPMILADVANDVDDGLSELERRALVEAAHYSSIAAFPLILNEEVLGTIIFLSFTPHAFADEERALLDGLCVQVAIIIEGLRLYDELRESKETLELYSERLNESMTLEHRISRTDVLTGLPNRRYIEEAMAVEATGLAGEGGICLMLVDIDQFKSFNDQFGHSFGDDVLKLVATVARSVCGPGDIAARLGGDEFLFLLPGKTLESAEVFAEGFRLKVEDSELRTADGQLMKLSVSVGVSGTLPGRNCSPDEIIERADRAMYRVKFRGGNGVAVCDDARVEVSPS